MNRKITAPGLPLSSFEIGVYFIVRYSEFPDFSISLSTLQFLVCQVYHIWAQIENSTLIFTFDLDEIISDTFRAWSTPVTDLDAITIASVKEVGSNTALFSQVLDFVFQNLGQVPDTEIQKRMDMWCE